METCHGYFACEQLDCLSRNSYEIPCWEIDGIWCDVHNDNVKLKQAEMGGKKEACKVCRYYQLSNNYSLQQNQTFPTANLDHPPSPR